MPPSGFQDLRQSLVTYRSLWINLGIRDIRGRYRRTAIGPFWTALSSGVLIVSLGLVYSVLWRQPINEYLPYFCAGYITWTFLTIVINESCQVFIGAETIIKSLRLPYYVHVLRLIWRNLIVFAHTLIVYVGVVLWFGIAPRPGALLAPVGVFLLCANFLWIGMVVAVACARFRDVIQIVANAMQILFFVTPIFWSVSLLADYPLARLVLADLNPVFHLVDVVRAPLVGELPSNGTWVFLGALALVGNLFAVTTFDRVRARIAFWL